MKRLATALVGIPLVLLITLYAPDWLFALVVAVSAVACFEELLGMAQARLGSRPGRWALPLGAVVTLSFLGGLSWVPGTIAAAFLVTAVIVSWGATLERALPNAAVAALGIVYCALLPGFLVLLERESVIVLLGILWAGDSAAYYGGRAFGRHPLAPSISPKKTVEGAFSGLTASMVVGVLMGIWLLDREPFLLLVASVVTAAAGQIGDLAESALKRSAGIKDSSSILPGHGGMLDRLDSLLFAAPMFYWLLGA